MCQETKTKKFRRLAAYWKKFPVAPRGQWGSDSSVSGARTADRFLGPSMPLARGWTPSADAKTSRILLRQGCSAGGKGLGWGGSPPSSRRGISAQYRPC